MSARAIRRMQIVEPLTIFALIMTYIWTLRFRYHGTWLVILALIVVSHAFRRETPAGIGFVLQNLGECLRRFGPALILLTLTLFCMGTLLQTTRPIRLEDAVLAWVAYVPWGIFQQYLLNGYFFNRLDGAFSPKVAAGLSAALFSGAHTPNWFLMLVGLAAGYCCACIYRSHKNLYFLGIAHGTVGALLFLVVPDSVSHHLVVGPGWFYH
jgi:membrane protease YdiL (CAAX protease family)